MIPVFTQNRSVLPAVPTKKAIYRLLRKGERLQARDAVYCPTDDYWKPLPVGRIGTGYTSRLGPVRRFNK